MLKEFKEFISQGNMLDLAVGVIIGAAFTAIVKSFVTNLVNPLIGLFLPSNNLGAASFKLLGATFKYGAFISDVINFFITAFVIFIMIKAINKVLRKKKEDDEATVNTELSVLTEIRDALKAQNGED